MEALVFDIDTKHGAEHNFSIYGDIHDGAHATDYTKLQAHMDRRAALPNAHFIGLGDLGDWIFPSDLARYTPGSRKMDIKTKGFDAIIDKELEDQAERWKQYPWEFIAMGNHEYQVLKRHYTNPSERLCQLLGTKYGGYSGFAQFRFRLRNKKVGKSFTFLYHHGAWGGRVVKGFGGARDYARGFEGWDVMAYGHNHQTVVHHESVLSQNSNGNLQARDRYFVNTGTWLHTHAQGGSPSYGEVKGYMPVALASPLITVKLRKNQSMFLDVSVSVGNC